MYDFINIIILFFLFFIVYNILCLYIKHKNDCYLDSWKRFVFVFLLGLLPIGIFYVVKNYFDQVVATKIFFCLVLIVFLCIFLFYFVENKRKR